MIREVFKQDTQTAADDQTKILCEVIHLIIEGPLSYIVESGYIELLFQKIQEEPVAQEELFAN